MQYDSRGHMVTSRDSLSPYSWCGACALRNRPIGQRWQQWAPGPTPGYNNRTLRAELQYQAWIMKGLYSEVIA